MNRAVNHRPSHLKCLARRYEAHRLRRIGHPMQFERTKPFVLYPVLPDEVRASVKNWLSRAPVKLWVSDTAEAKALRQP
jgi:hypothetical protein